MTLLSRSFRPDRLSHLLFSPPSRKAWLALWTWFETASPKELQGAVARMEPVLSWDAELRHVEGHQPYHPLWPFIGSLRLPLAPERSSLPSFNAILSLEALELSSSLTSLAGLSNLPNLHSLDLSRCPKLSDISALSSLSSLRFLALSECTALTELSPLASLTALETLHLWGCLSLSDISVLAGLPSLRSLNLSLCPSLSELSPLISLPNLETLWLSDSPALQLPPLRGKERMEERKDVASYQERLRLHRDGLPDFQKARILRLLEQRLASLQEAERSRRFYACFETALFE